MKSLAKSITTTSRATGPRTAAGKRRSSRNAAKFGLFSRHIILEGEDPAAFNKLHSDLREYHQPKGSTEDLLVEEVTIVFWRKRRLLAAETAMIARSPAFVGFSNQSNQDLPNQSRLRRSLQDGSSAVSDKSLLLATTMAELSRMREDIKMHGLDLERDVAALFKAYDYYEFDSEEGFCKRFFELYSYSVSTELHGPLTMSIEDCATKAIELIDFESERLAELSKKVTARDVVWTSLASLVPVEADLDRIIRCDTHLDRKLDRLLSRLERLQRTRQGCPSPPMIRIDLDR